MQLIKPQEVVNTGIYRAAPVNARFDINQIAPHIQSAEERHLIHLLGSALYNDMVANQNTAVSNYNPDAGPLVDKFPNDPNYETLWTLYLLRFNSYIVWYEALPFIVMNVTSKGIFQNDSEFAQNGGMSALKFMQDTMMQRMENLKDIIQEYLCQNKAAYPLFNSKHCPCNSCGSCEDECGCGNSSNWCSCGSYGMYGFCRTCKRQKNNSTNIIFY
jgi:hypothetical protein